MGSIKWKMATLYMILVVTVMCGCGVFILFNLRSGSYGEVFRESEYTAERVIDLFSMQAIEKEQTPEQAFSGILTSLMIENINSSAGSAEQKQVYLLDEEGVLLYGRNRGLSTADLSSRAIVDSLMGIPMTELYVHKTYEGEIVGDYAIRFTLPQNKTDYVLFIRQSMTLVEANIRNMTMVILLITGVGIVVAGILGYMLAVSVADPITKLTKKTKELAAGNLEIAGETVVKRRISESDELDLLEVNFDEMAQKLTTSIRELQAMEQMQKEFVANVSHELRTPITTIKSYVDTLLDSEENDPELTRHFLSVVSHESDRMTALITDLLELSKMDSGQLKKVEQPIEMGALLLQCLNDLEWDAGKKHQDIEWAGNMKLQKNTASEDSLALPLGKFYIMGDERRIEQVIRNLLTNAIKYSGENTVITGGVYRVKAEKNVEIRVAVKDCGIGISPEDQERIFERFYRVDKARSRSMGGTGLGLAIAKETTEMYEGRIWIESKLGEGSTFWVAFPEAGNVSKSEGGKEPA